MSPETRNWLMLLELDPAVTVKTLLRIPECVFAETAAERGVDTMSIGSEDGYRLVWQRDEEQRYEIIYMEMMRTQAKTLDEAREVLRKWSENDGLGDYIIQKARGML